MLNIEKLIRVEHINKYFGSFKAIDDISFELDGGKYMVLLALMAQVNLRQCQY